MQSLPRITFEPTKLQGGFSRQPTCGCLAEHEQARWLPPILKKQLLVRSPALSRNPSILPPKGGTTNSQKRCFLTGERRMRGARVK